MRAQELLEKGKVSLAGLTDDADELNSPRGELFNYGIAVNGLNEGELQKLWLQLRAEADGWNVSRQEWMMAKLKTGAHPDTDAEFWHGFWASEPPSLNIEWVNWSEEVGASMREGIAVLCFGVASFFAGVLFLVRRRRLRVI